MPKRKRGKASGKSRNGSAKRKIKQKQRDRFVVNAVIVAVAAILLVLVANIIGTGNRFIPELSSETPVQSFPGENAMPFESSKQCRIDFLDVGQGDCSLITTPGDGYILIDAGTASSRDEILKFLEASGVDELDYLILTHPHNDHIGSASAVLSEYDVKCVIMPDVSTTSSQFERLYDALVLEKEQGCRIYSAVPGDVYEVGGCSMNIIGPYECDDENLNNCSIAMIFTYGEFDAFFAGDTESDVEKQLISAGSIKDCELYKVSHHGSDTSNSQSLIDILMPEISVISCGKDNSYGHPSTAVVKRLYDCGSTVYNTAENGTVTVATDGAGYSVYITE